MLEETGLTGAWPTGLDPATDASGSANQSYLDAIYGNLFELGANGQTIDDLATGYTISADAKTVTIELRPGVTFSDGTPFNATAVAFNFKRDLAAPVGDTPKWPVSSITTSGSYDVVHPPDPAVRAADQHVPRRQRQLDRVADRAEQDGRERVQARAGRGGAVHRRQRHGQLRAGAEEEPGLLARRANPT